MNDPFFDNLARRFFGPVSDWMDWATPAITSTAVNGLLTDVKETKDAYEVHVDVPGIDKNNIKMNYHDGVLSINVHKDDITDHADKNGNVMMSERNYGTMSRKLSNYQTLMQATSRQPIRMVSSISLCLKLTRI